MQPQYETAEQIASAIHHGDKKAESILLDRYYRTILFILKRRGLDDEFARDLCQETFRIAIERLRDKPLAEPSKIAAFMHGIAVKLFVSESRKAARRQTFTDDETVQQAVEKGLDQFTTLSNERTALIVRRLLEELTNERDQRILLRYYIDELDKHDICAELTLSHRHFDKVISRARVRFKQLLEASGQDSLLEVLRGG